MIDYSYTELNDRIIEIFESDLSKNYSTEATEATFFMQNAMMSLICF